MQHPFIAVRNHWDPRVEGRPWAAYAAEADAKLEKTIADRGPGLGFHECLNFAFDHPDNLPLLHLYLPPSCLPSESSCDTSDLLVFIFTYKGGDQGAYPAHLVALAGHATLAAGQEGVRRASAGHLYGGDLRWHIAAAHEHACVLVEPIPLVDLDVPSLTAKFWGEGRRYLQPAEAWSILRLVVQRAEAVIPVSGGNRQEAARRQLAVCVRLLESYPNLKLGLPVDRPPPSTGQRRGAPVHPDDRAGCAAEEYVYGLELREVAAQLRGCGREGRAEDWVRWWRDLGRTYENHDIRSVRFDATGTAKTLLLEVKSSRASDFSTVHISESQIECAEQAKKVGNGHEFVFVQTSEEGEPVVGSDRRLDLDEVRPLLRPVQWRVKSFLPS